MEITIQLFDDAAWTDAAVITVSDPSKGGIDGACLFEYNLDYAFREDCHDRPVSLIYPVAADILQQKQWPSFLYDLIPQGNGRKFLLGELGRPFEEGRTADFELLRSGAFNPIGRLRVKEAVQFYETYVNRHSRETMLDGLQFDDILNKSDQFVERMYIHGMLAAGTTGIQGAAPKFMLTQNKAGLWFADGQISDVNSAKHWIVKLPRGKQAADVKVLRNEAAYLKAAGLVGLRVTEDVEFHNNMLFVARFDRCQSVGEPLVRLHQESLASIAGIVGYDARPTQFELLAALRSVATDKTADTIEFIKRDVLNLAMRNTDNHARNTAIQVVDGNVQLTPLYDFAPMYLDPEMIPRAARWYKPGTREELADWIDILRAIGCEGQEQIQVIEALMTFAEDIKRLPEIMLDSGVDQDIVEFLQPSIKSQRESIMRVEELVGQFRPTGKNPYGSP